ncbi:hypothetical protein H4Q32_007787 [Labeo rohita]|uniref:SSUH2-like protein n=1 Tax=Labeo rohita TaxID=84645 RepID=A0ABQ8MIC9_LABRO|nr:hypothetical protein H4Q32_007787 [Labeo rohita]
MSFLVHNQWKTYLTCSFESRSAMAAAPATSTYGPSAPPANMFDTFPGYEGTVAGGGGGYLPPPMPAPMPVPERAPSSPDWHIPSISEDQAREAFSTYVSSKCCYGSAPVREGAVDAGVQPAPGPWLIAAQTPAFFQEHKQTIKNCHTCLGTGRRPCTTCSGAGNKPCWVCNGSGYPVVHVAATAFASVTPAVERDSCSSSSTSLSTEKDDFIAQDSSGLRVENLGKVSGKELYKDAQYMVYPVRGFPDVAVAQASERLVGDHQVKYAQTSRILQQRQTIELIPITKVNYMWKGKSYVYYVFGNEFKVNADDYPDTCCCSVM